MFIYLSVSKTRLIVHLCCLQAQDSLSRIERKKTCNAIELRNKSAESANKTSTDAFLWPYTSKGTHNCITCLYHSCLTIWAVFDLFRCWCMACALLRIPLLQLRCCCPAWHSGEKPSSWSLTCRVRVFWDGRTGLTASRNLSQKNLLLQ